VNGSPHALSDVLAGTKVRAKDTSRWRLPVLRPGLGGSSPTRIPFARRPASPSSTHHPVCNPCSREDDGQSMRQVWRAGIKFCQKNAEIAQEIEKARIYFSPVSVSGNSIPQFTAKCSNCDMTLWSRHKAAQQQDGWRCGQNCGDCAPNCVAIPPERSPLPLNNWAHCLRNSGRMGLRGCLGIKCTVTEFPNFARCFLSGRR
jgi:hypothetical protein